VKTGIRNACGEFILIVDADGQHRAADALRIAARLGEYDLVVGARRPEAQATSTRRAGNAILNSLAGYVTDRHIPDLTSGIRGARRECLREFIHLLPNGFSTPTTTTLAFIKAGYNVMFEPIEAQPRVGRSKLRVARDGARFFLILLKLITIFSPLRIFVPLSALAFAVGGAYGLVNFVAAGRIPNGAVVLLLFSVIVFLVGLVSEQIASLRFASSEQANRPRHDEVL
jgi:glycosyltransferase involved in cell wall biosynthesis